jgi:hypothetical protein
VTFLDSSVIIDMLEGVPDVVESVEDRGQPYRFNPVLGFLPAVTRGGGGGPRREILTSAR